MNDPDRKEKAESTPSHDFDGVVGAAVGGAGGVYLGTVAGLALGGPLGAAIGAGAGTLVGMAVGYAIDYDTNEDEFRTHHASNPAHARHSWDQASSGYRYGWESHDRPEFHDKTYDQIRPELHKGWTGSSDFADFEPYIKHAWQRRADLRQDGSFSQAAKA